MNPAQAEHRLAALERESAPQREPGPPKRGPLDVGFALDVELEGLSCWRRIRKAPVEAVTEGERAEADRKARRILAAIRARMATGVRPPDAAARRERDERLRLDDQAQRSMGAHGLPEMIAKGCACSSCAPPAAAYELAMRTGRTVEPNADGTFTARFAPGLDLKFAFDPHAKADPSQFVGSALATPPPGLAAKKAAPIDTDRCLSPSDGTPEPQPEPAATPVAAAERTDWRSSPYDDPTPRQHRRRRGNGARLTAGIEHRVF